MTKRTKDRVIHFTGDAAHKLAQSFHADCEHGLIVVGDEGSIQNMANHIRAYGDERAKGN